MLTGSADVPQGTAEERRRRAPSGVTDPAQPSETWDSHLEWLLSDWQTRAWAAQIGHYRIASRLWQYNLWLGLPVVIFTTAVGTSLFATLNDKTLPPGLRITVGSISVIAAVLAGIQAFLSSAKRADQHAVDADWYASIRRKIEQQGEHTEGGSQRPEEVPRRDPREK